MKLPRYSLRTLLIVVTVAALVAGGFSWRQSRLAWIRQRHAFMRDVGWSGCVVRDGSSRCPWSLKIFGEGAIVFMYAPPELCDRAAELFPESWIIPVNNWNGSITDDNKSNTLLRVIR
jgi:hypothetical protein